MTSDQYKQRGENLKRLGFANYEAYLTSPIWRYIRSLVFKRSRGVCESCGINKTTQVHHESYSIRALLGHRLKSLVAVCDMCHEMAHGAELDPTRSPALVVSDRKTLERSYIKVGAIGQPREMTPRLVSKGR